jgi:hypothetical protein
MLISSPFFVLFLWALAMFRAPGPVVPVVIAPQVNLNPRTAGPQP